jgi:hypothetical protein
VDFDSPAKSINIIKDKGFSSFKFEIKEKKVFGKNFEGIEKNVLKLQKGDSKSFRECMLDDLYKVAACSPELENDVRKISHDILNDVRLSVLGKTVSRLLILGLMNDLSKKNKNV